MLVDRVRGHSCWPCGTGILACRAERSSVAPSLRSLRTSREITFRSNQQTFHPPPPLPTFVITACPERSRREGRQARGICIFPHPPSVTSVNSKLRVFLLFPKTGKTCQAPQTPIFPLTYSLQTKYKSLGFGTRPPFKSLPLKIERELGKIPRGSLAPKTFLGRNRPKKSKRVKPGRRPKDCNRQLKSGSVAATDRLARPKS